MSGSKKRSLTRGSNKETWDTVLARWVAVYSEHYGKPLTQGDIDAYMLGLQGVHPADLDRAFLTAMREAKKFKPTVGEVLACVTADPTRDTGEQMFIVPQGADHCYAEDPKVVGFHEGKTVKCGCRKCAPQFYCEHVDGAGQKCTRQKSRGHRFCYVHYPGSEDRERERPEYKSPLQQLADHMAMEPEDPPE